MRYVPLTQDFDYSDLPGIGARRTKGCLVKLNLVTSNTSEAGFYELFMAMRFDAINKSRLKISTSGGMPLRYIDRDSVCKAKSLTALVKECMIAVKQKELQVELMSSFPVSDAEVSTDLQHLVSFYNVEITMATSDREKLQAIVKYCRGMLQYQPYETGNDFVYGMLLPYLLCFQNDLILPKTKCYVKANRGVKETVAVMQMDIGKVSAFVGDNVPPHEAQCGITDMQLMYYAQSGDTRYVNALVGSVEPGILVEAQYAAACRGHVPFIGALRAACRASGIGLSIEAPAYNGETPLAGARRYNKPRTAAWIHKQSVKPRLFSSPTEVPEQLGLEVPAALAPSLAS
ncbi:MAG: hypothetical protein P1U40_13145 [Coxiellaceae bacterium]|nr:hypothetical protein [Coxiellaceae bacterium]